MSKKIMRFIAFFMAVIVMCSCSPKGKADSENEGESVNSGENAGDLETAENETAGTSSWKRTEIEKPEGSEYIYGLNYLADGTIRINASNQDIQNSRIWDSKDQGISWENADVDMSLLSGNEYGLGYSREGNLYAYDNESLILSTGDGTEPKTFHTNQGESFTDAAVTGNTLAVLVENLDSWQMHVEIYDLQTMECRQIDNAELSECLSVLAEMGGNIALNGSGDVLYLSGNEIGMNRSGIGRYDLSEDKFSYLLDQETAESMMHPGKDNGLLQDTEIVVSFTVDDKEDKLVLCTMSMEKDERHLYLCERGIWEEEKQASREKLRIYSLKQWFTRQAATIFQEKHPELEVTFEVGYTGEDGVTLSDAIRTLNTELMAGEGPDILVMDGLPADSYIQKGILEDLTGIVEPEKEKYFYNVISACNKGENIYQVPTDFRVPIILGDADTVAVKNREELMDVLRKKSVTGIPFIPSRSFSVAALELFITSDILGETLDEKKLAEYYRDMKTIANLCYSEEEWEKMNYTDKMAYMVEFVYPDGGFNANLEIYFDKAQAGIEKISILSEYLEILSACKEKGFSYQHLNREYGNYFIAGNVLGVNHNGKNPDAAKQFIQEYLSGELQIPGPLANIPITRSMLWDDKYISEDGEYSGAVSGKYTPDEIMPLYKMTPAELQELIQFFEELDTPVKDDAIVLQKVMEQADACVFEGKDPESAAKEVCSEVNLYLSE